MCRNAICKWSKEFYKNSRQALNDLRNQLDQAMSNPIPDETLIAELNTRLLNTYKEEENFWRQRSRQLWLALGDSNSGFFHASTKGRKAKNRMTVLEDEDGLPCFEQELISGVISKYYEKLFTATTYDEEQTIQEALKPCVSQVQNEVLIMEPTLLEIKEATFAIHADKAP